MINYDKNEVKQQLTIDDIFQLLVDFGGEPVWSPLGIISSTICHNPAGTGSKKLYYYKNDTSGLFKCYTGCENSSFDIFELIIRVFKIQENKEINLNEAVRWVAQRFGIAGSRVEDDLASKIEDWQYLTNYERIQDIELKIQDVVLKEYDSTILKNFNYNVRLTPWLNDHITQEVLQKAQIGYYPGGDQITIPHFDENGRFIGLRGRTMSIEDAELYGKYRPLKINKTLYTHPLSFNLYNLNNSKDNIRALGKAIVLESEKSCLQYASYFGWENNICVACCGSSISNYQIELLKKAGAKEIVIAFDRQFLEIGDSEFKKLKANLLKLRMKYKNDVLISFIFDKAMITPYKASPTDVGKEVFLQLFKERIVL